MKRLVLFVLFVGCLSTNAHGQYVRRVVSGGAPVGGGTGNATVPADAPIQPPQAFVDAYPLFLNAFGDETQLNLSGIGITHLDPNLLNSYLSAQTHAYGAASVDLSGNALDAAEVNTLLYVCTGFPPGTLDLSGGTNAAPTGQGLVDLQTLRDAGWTVTTN